jgi:hypothetical protein
LRNPPGGWRQQSDIKTTEDTRSKTNFNLIA